MKSTLSKRTLSRPHPGSKRYCGKWKKGARFRVIKDACGDLPKSLIRKKGTVIKFYSWDQGCRRVYALLEATLDGRKKHYWFYEDEIEAV